MNKTKFYDPMDWWHILCKFVYMKVCICESVSYMLADDYYYDVLFHRK